MAGLDSLEIQITATTDKAIDSIDRLINTLGKLSTAFNVNGVHSFVQSIQSLSKALDSINGDNLKNVSGAIDTLSKSAKSLANIRDGAKQAGDGVSQLAREIATEFNITDNNAIQLLTQQIRELYRSTDQSSLMNSVSAINELIMKYSQFKTEVSGTNQEVQNFLKNTKIHLDNDWAKELRDDHRWIHTTIGLLNTTREGGLEASEALKRMKELGADVTLTPNNNDALRAIAEWINEQKKAEEQTLSFNQAIRENIITYSALDAALERIANAAGLTTARLGEMATNGPSETTNSGFQQMAVMLERLESVGNPFENILIGLRELGSITLSDSLTNLNSIKDVISAIGNKSGQNAGEALGKIAAGMNTLSGTQVPKFGDDLAVFTQQMRALGSKTIVNASTALSGIANGLNALKAVGDVPAIGGIQELAQSLSLFGRKSASEAATVIPRLATAFRGLIDTLSKAPTVSQNVIDLANAMANLSANTKSVSPATKHASAGISLFSKHAKKAQKSAFNLASAIGMLYAKYWTLLRIIRIFGKSVNLASDLTETQNVVDHVFADMKYRMEDFAKTSVETVGMSELTAKKIGSRFQSMGKNMGISQEAMRKTNDFVQATTNGYADMADSAADMAINLTRLTGDMASFYNLDYEDVAEDMEAIYTGMTRPLRKYGLDLTQATLKEFALANGLNADIKEMTQAEKTLLRYQYVMANTTAAHGDFQRTVDTWANSVRIAKENFKKLQIVIGKIVIYSFKPLVKSFNVAMNDILHMAESTFNALGTIFGWQLEITDVGVVDDLADGLEDVSDGYEDASKEAKKFKNFLLGIDELNLLPDDKDNDNGSGTGDALGAMAAGIQDSLVDFKKTESGFDSMYDTLYKLGERVAEVKKEWLQSIPWDEVYEKAREFGTNVASYLNGYLSDTELFYEKGKFVANGINTVANALDAFFQKFEGKQLGIDFGTMINGFTENLDWNVIESAAQGFATDFFEMINGFFETTKFDDIATTIATGLNVALEAIYTIGDGIEWENIGQAISDFVNGFFDPEEGFDFTKFGETINTWIDGIQSTLKTAFTGDENGEGGIDWGNVLSGFKDFFKTVELDNVAFIIGVITVQNAAKWVFSGAALSALATALKGLFAKAIAKIGLGAMLSGLLAKSGTLLFADLGNVFAVGVLADVGVAIGTALIGGIVAAFLGFNFGKLLGEVFTDDDQWYKDFKWFGDDGFFKTVFGDVDAAIDGLVMMLNDFSEHPVIATLANMMLGIFRPLIDGTKLLKDAINDAGGLKNALEDVGEALFRPWAEAPEFWKQFFTDVGNGFKGLIDDAKWYWNDLFDRIGSGMSDFVYDCIRWWQFLFDDIAKGVSDWWNNDIVPWFSFDTWLDLFWAIYDAMGQMWDQLMDWWNNTAIGQWVDEYLSPFFSLDNWMGFLKFVIEAFEKTGDMCVEAVKGIWNAFADFVNSHIQITIPEIDVPFSNEKVPETVIGLKIPKFATGGSIPNDGNLFFANENGPEIVANMGSRTGVMNTDQMEQAIANGMARALANNSQNVTVVLNGDAANFFTAMVKENNNYIMRTGASPMRV